MHRKKYGPPHQGRPGNARSGTGGQEEAPRRQEPHDGETDLDAEESHKGPKSKSLEAQETRLAKLKAQTHAEARKPIKDSCGDAMLHEKYQVISDFSLTVLREDFDNIALW